MVNPVAVMVEQVEAVVTGHRCLPLAGAGSVSKVGAVPLLSPFLQRRRIRQVVPYLTGDVLDFGCGNGALSEHAGSYVGVDVNRETLAVAKNLYGAEFCHVDDLDPGRRFDTIAAVAVLEHLHHPEKHLADLTERLRPGGRIVATTPHPSWEWMVQVGGRVGLTARSTSHSHVTLLDRGWLEMVGAAAGLRLVEYRRFLAGVNQLAVYAAS